MASAVNYLKSLPVQVLAFAFFKWRVHRKRNVGATLLDVFQAEFHSQLYPQRKARSPRTWELKKSFPGSCHCSGNGGPEKWGHTHGVGRDSKHGPWVGEMSLLLPPGSQAPWMRGRKQYFSKSLYPFSKSLGLRGHGLPNPLLQWSTLLQLWGQTVMKGEISPKDGRWRHRDSSGVFQGGDSQGK